MYSILTAQAPASDDLWTVFAALRLLDEATEVVGAAAVEAGRLVERANWQNEGMRRLRWALSDLRAELGAERSELAFLREQLARMADA
ncbi:hypothetical protein [Microbacterium soli]|uniref:Uncharacterized protein n=1 Tax=Microbacterium soli TaxID=446075 RepID=A0ABP7N3D0_9MICO